MSACPFYELVSRLKMPSKIRALPKDNRGRVIPFFAPVIDGEGQPSLAQAGRAKTCVRHNLCWICGQKLGNAPKAFIGGPKSVENRCFSDGPMHVECAEYAAKACPFIADPHYKRRVERRGNPAPGCIEAKPERMAIYVAEGYTFAHDLFLPWKPIKVTWWKDGQQLP